MLQCETGVAVGYLSIKDAKGSPGNRPGPAHPTSALKGTFMSKNHLGKLSALAALAFTSATLALSAPPTNPPAPGGDGPKPGAGERKRPKFEDLDKNGDGFITEDEVSKEQWDRIKKRDKDGDGKVSKDEFGAPRPGGPRPGGDGPKGPGPGNPPAPPPAV